MRTKLSRIFFLALLALTLCTAQVAHAVLADRGPVDRTAPGAGFPTWYMDTTGTAVELCIPTAPTCTADPVDTGDPLSVAAGFGTEAFYWGAGATATSGAASCDLVLALEAAWNTLSGNPAAGRQSVFSRLRVSCDNLPAVGRYTFLHPYGQLSAQAAQDPATGVISIRQITRDIGLISQAFDRALTSPNVGPFLRQVTAPAGFLGSPNFARRVTGSPLVPPRNSFTVNGPGGFSASTNFFTIEGRLATNGGLQVPRATYSRDRISNAGTVDVVARSIGNQNIQVAGVGTSPIIPTMTEDPNDPGRYTVSIPFNAGEPFTPITVTNVSANPNVVVTKDVIDVVTISSAVWTSVDQTLTVNVLSSDRATRANGGPLLQVFSGGQLLGNVLGNGVFTFQTAVAPARITVRSDKGGSDTLRVTRQ